MVNLQHLHCWPFLLVHAFSLPPLAYKRTPRHPLPHHTSSKAFSSPIVQGLSVSPKAEDLSVRAARQDLSIFPKAEDLSVFPKAEDLSVFPKAKDLSVRATRLDLFIFRKAEDLSVFPKAKDLSDFQVWDIGQVHVSNFDWLPFTPLWSPSLVLHLVYLIPSLPPAHLR
jgi:hypothetical protein